MATVLQSAVLSRLTARQVRSLSILQDKVERPRGYAATVRVTPAQFAALQAAYDAAKASGVPIPAEVFTHAKNLGLK